MAAVFGVECSLRAGVPHQCRHRVTDQLSGEGTAAGKGRSRQDGLGKKVQSGRVERRGVPNVVEKGIISELNYSVGDKV